MELVYLWVKEYKNIKKQGFNFSPRFDCKFDGKTLTIDENEDYVSIFPKNINITAIVGENGSGKSTLLKILLNIFAEGHDKPFFDYILIYEDNGRLLCSSNIKFNEINNLIKDYRDFNPYDEGLSNYHDDVVSVYLNNEAQRQSIFTDKESHSNVQLSKHHISFLTTRKRSLFILENYIQGKYDFLKYKESFFILNKIIISFNGHGYTPYKSLTNDIEYYGEEAEKHIKDVSSRFRDYTFFDKLKELHSLFDFKRNKHQANDTLIDLSSKKSASYFRKYKLANNFLESIPDKIQNSESKSSRFEFNINDLDTNLFEFLTLLPEDVFEIELVDVNNTFFSQLSYGERQLLTQLHLILNSISKLDYTIYHPEQRYDDESTRDEYYTKHDIKKVLLFIDEFELGLHPFWQKNVMNYIIEFLKEIKKDFHLVLTNHSPFILSDLPKENVIFLKDGKQIDVDIDTFGANIHTLLSHGFFMKDGLMGGFAKEKIQSIIKYHNELSKKELNKKENEFLKVKFRSEYEKDKKEQFTQIQKIIGDDYLKQVIKNHLIEIEKILYDDFMLDKEIKQLETKLEKLRGLKSNASS